PVGPQPARVQIAGADLAKAATVAVRTRHLLVPVVAPADNVTVRLQPARVEGADTDLAEAIAARVRPRHHPERVGVVSVPAVEVRVRLHATCRPGLAATDLTAALAHIARTAPADHMPVGQRTGVRGAERTRPVVSGAHLAERQAI